MLADFGTDYRETSPAPVMGSEPEPACPIKRKRPAIRESFQIIGINSR